VGKQNKRENEAQAGYVIGGGFAQDHEGKEKVGCGIEGDE